MKNSIYNSLLKIQGIGPNTAERICAKLGITKYTSLKDLPTHLSDRYTQYLTYIRNLTSADSQFSPIEKNLIKLQSTNISRLISIQSYRGSRHKLGYPTRGQRTRSNAVTARKRKFHL